MNDDFSAAVPNNTSAFDVIVIGCGGFGAAALSHLAHRGLRVLGIDQSSPPHNLGSSHGETRVIRKAYFEHPDYVPLLHRAYTLWNELDERQSAVRNRNDSQAALFVRCGLLLAGPKDGEVIRGARQSAAEHGLAIDNLTDRETRLRFPQVRVADGHHTLFEPDAGFLWVERCVTAHLADAQRHGAQLLTNQSVTGLEIASNSVTVRTSLHQYSAARLVVTAGAWSGEFLAKCLPDCAAAYAGWIRIKRKTLFWHPFTDPIWADTSRSPIHLFELPENRGQFYGFPSVDGQTVKLAEHTGGQFVDGPDSLDRTVHPDEGRAVADYATSCLDGVNPRAVRNGVCMYSMSPDGHFLLDRLPDTPVIVAAGFSGHGFKFTPVIGEAIADLVQHGTTPLPVGFLSARRLPQ